MWKPFQFRLSWDGWVWDLESLHLDRGMGDFWSRVYVGSVWILVEIYNRKKFGKRN